MKPCELFLFAMDVITLLISLSPIVVTFIATVFLHRRARTRHSLRLSVLAALWLAVAAAVRGMPHPVFRGDEDTIEQAHQRIAAYSWEVSGLHAIEYIAFLAFAVALLMLFRAHGHALRGNNI